MDPGYGELRQKRYVRPPFGGIVLIAAVPSPSSLTRDPLLGHVLDGKYEVVEMLARGGMGRVYRAIQRPLGRAVALKVLDSNLASGDAAADFEKRFFLEAAACAKLTHPHSVVVYDYGKAEEGIFYIAMELLEGRTLSQEIRAFAPLDPARVVHIALQICGSLAEAHSHGMVHRDVKPGNIMLTSRGADDDYVTVLDFGLVKGHDSDLTESGAVLGTPRYIAPEQIASTAVTPAADIYSLGAVLYHLLAGRPPFESESKFVLMASHVNVEPPRIDSVVVTSASDQLQDVIMRCLRKAPEERFESMSALVDALVRCPEETGVGASSLPSASSSSPSLSGQSGPVPRAPIPVPSTASPSSPTIAGSPKSMRPADASEASGAAKAGWLKLAAVLGIVLAFGLVGVIVASQTGEVEAEPEPEVTVNESAGNEEPEAPVAAPQPEAAGDCCAVSIRSEPAGARVTVDGMDYGDTPTVVDVPQGERWAAEISLEGYDTREIALVGREGELSVTLQRAETVSGAMRRRPGMRRQPVVEEPPPPTPMETASPMRGGSRSDNLDPWNM